MTAELAVVEPEYVDIFDEPSDSDGLRDEIDSILQSIRNQELTLATSHARLGWKLLKVQKEKRWVGWGFPSFGSYIDSIRERIDRGRASIYACISVAEKLLPSVSEEDLDRMGISRAQELARFVKQSGRRVPEHLLAVALDDSKRIDEVHVAVLEALHEKCDPKGNWLSLEGFYALPDEKKEIEQAYERAKAMLQLPSDTPEHQVRKEVMLAWVRDFMATNPLPEDNF